MEAYDFLNERLKPIIKGDYRDFSSKKVEGYSLFVSEYKKPHVQAMVRADILELLQNTEVKYSEVTKGEANLHKSQISRWYVNGFTDMYNGCRRNDLKHPLENHDYLTLANKFRPVEDLNSGQWSKDKYRLYGYLRDRKVVINADENLFIQYVTHAYFSPLYQDGKKVNIRYTIAQLKDYYGKGWLKAVCENINVSEKYITQRPPSEDFRKNFPSLIIKK